MAIATTDAQTDVAPFSPHNHGVSPRCAEAATLMPRGNAIPMKSPIGKRRAVARLIRTIVAAPAK